jgi:hypothetical protein
LPAALPDDARGMAGTLLGRLLRPRAGAWPGESLGLLPDRSASDGPEWASPRPEIACAFARAHDAIDRAARRTVPEGVRRVVLDELDRWDGEPPGISRAWLTEPVSRLPEAERPAARLALLTALSSFQIDHETVTAFRERDSSDRALVETVAWAAFTAADRLGARLAGRAGTSTG